MPQVDVFLERFHQHQYQIFLGILLSFKKLDELVVLEQNI
jgi:hypothetical protein